MRKTAMLWLVLAVICGGMLFQTSQRVTDGRAQLAGIENAARKEDEHLRVLQAEWSYLNQPDRLEKLSKQYLQLAPLKGKQFTKVSDLEQRPVNAVASTGPVIDPEAPAALPEVAADVPVVEAPQEETPAIAAAPAAPAAPLLKPAPPKPATAAVKPPVVKGKPQQSLVWKAPPPPAARKPAVVWSAPPPRKNPPPAQYTPPPQRNRGFNDLMKSLGVQ
ncbi:MAG: hypothetical protein K0R10_347 [Alphaproteobacteria bacterium]|jgi:hypothetical protein|nr:hypothetical protein [Alphaproteobacteria bacterium]